MKGMKIVLNGIIKENPVFCLLLGMCSTLATTTSAINGLGMGVCTMFVLMCSNVVISLIKNVVPDKVRIPAFIVVIATFVTILQLLLQAYVPALNKSLGIFIPLIVVNCIILGRAESFASKNNAFDSLLDGIGIGLGFTLALTILGIVREVLGTGAIFGFKFIGESDGILLFILPPGAFIALGYLIALVNRLRAKYEK
ncbi:MAG: electron transport complex subunit E [Bacteroidales bacterium]|jgi:electron transport complex protein RnfE|nr:electron transport complex subunit E [Bacteroidales bacterium]MBQ6754699.1 electron transport complex subunit E [Bacteroidales bacterium]MDY6380838.1 electron transport complex subunit E [Bacteroidales bacterium]MDY6394190.1 electron transport complex subunit E [Bacteroidales bacterium]MDY6395561.1 electron transport complex subunit E [Bacteroidales bacterium]